jgi:hypothetical protein
MARVKSHDFLVMMASGLLSRAIALGLGPEGRTAATALDQLFWAWRLLLQPSVKPEVGSSDATSHTGLHYLPLT